MFQGPLCVGFHLSALIAGNQVSIVLWSYFVTSDTDGMTMRNTTAAVEPTCKGG